MMADADDVIGRDKQIIARGKSCDIAQDNNALFFDFLRIGNQRVLSVRVCFHVAKVRIVHYKNHISVFLLHNTIFMLFAEREMVYTFVA